MNKFALGSPMYFAWTVVFHRGFNNILSPALVTCFLYGNARIHTSDLRQNVADDAQHLMHFDHTTISVTASPRHLPQKTVN